jgi:hypothetical protein
MKLFRRKKAAPEPADLGMSRQEAMACRPAINAELEMEKTEDGLQRITYYVLYTPWYGRLARRFGAWDGAPQQKTIELDTLGSMVISWIDGERSVNDLIVRLSEKYELPRREAEIAITSFLRELGKRGIVAMQTD